MAKRAPSGNPSEEESRINTLDVALLDLFAQTEAILRCGREIERSIVTLRGGNGALSATKRVSVVSKIQQAATEMHQKCSEMGSLAGDVAQAAQEVE